MHRIKEIHLDVPVTNTSLSSYFFGCHLYLQYKLLGTRSRPMDTQSAILYVCSGYSLEADLSNVNGSFTLSRFMKRPKTFCDLARDEYPQLMVFREIYFVKYIESVSPMYKPIRRRTLTLLKCCSLAFVGSHAKVAEVVNSVDYESASNMSRYAGNTCTYPNSLGCIFIHIWVRVSAI